MYINKESPLGIMPKKIWIEKRMCDILGAIERYVNSGVGWKPVVFTWIEELKGLQCTYMNICEKGKNE